ncbi:hypothetical protein Patl1_33305 [Pistacia atlantica]|uniref:Uncharacterized protein n=1 Tax=Pistacia atlantica TaxID=434234 RepID=A0ACC0ZPN1_9ROSI|nr:hypothetical protein Patl1_33305 [Pistacia atlantica]
MVKVMKNGLCFSKDQPWLSLRDFHLWRRYMNGKDFVTTLDSYLRKLSLIRVVESPHMDNMEVLKALIYAEKDPLPLLKGASKTTKQFGIEVLKSKIVLLLISEIAERKFICLYGGDNIEWIRKFNGPAATVAKAVKIPLEILYVGQSNLKLEIDNNISIINKQKFSHALQDLHLVWFLWVWLQNMLDSRKKLGCTVDNDSIMLKIDTILSCDRSNKEWAVFWRNQPWLC